MKTLEIVSIICLVVGFTIATMSFFGLASNQGAMGLVRKGNTTHGYWGPVASSVDWCEENYVENPYIAEWHNTLSSGFIALSGVVAMLCAFNVNAEKRFYLLGFVFMVVGLGSVAFHGALLRHMQAADEVPMIWLACVGCYVTLEHHNTVRQHTILPYVIFVFLVGMTALNIAFDGPLAVAVFHLSFAPFEVTFFVQTIRLYVKTVKNKMTKRILLESFFFYSAAMVSWALDNVFCAHFQNLPYNLPNPQTHAWGWHIFVAYATYGLIIATMQERMEVVLKQPIEIGHLIPGLIPWLTIKKSKKEKKM